MTPRDDDTARRIRLEGGAELLQQAEVRYRALAGVLKGLLWRERLHKNADIAVAVASGWGAVDQALRRAVKLSEQEQWPPRGELTRLTHKVAELSEELSQLAVRRSPEGAMGSTPELISALVDSVSSGPQGQSVKWRLAQQALPATLPELESVRVYVALLESLFGRPLPPEGFGWTVEEARLLESALPAGEEQIAGLWRRVSALPQADRVERLLLDQARLPPRSPAADGPQTLVAAEYWRKLGWQKLHNALRAQLEPVQVQDHEAPRVFRYLAEAEAGSDAELAADELIPDGRAALIMLARSLWGGATSANDAEWERRLALARRVDGANTADPDVKRVRDTLTLYARVKRRSASTEAGSGASGTLSAALEEAREWAQSVKRRPTR